MVDLLFKACLVVAAVQEERQRNKERGEGEVESTSSANSEMPVERILEAELSVEPKHDQYVDTQVCMFLGCTVKLEILTKCYLRKSAGF